MLEHRLGQSHYFQSKYFIVKFMEMIALLEYFDPLSLLSSV